MAFDPTTAQLVPQQQGTSPAAPAASGFDPSTAELVQQEPSTLSKVGDYLSGASKALSGGVWSGIADTDQAIGNGTTALLQHIHVISPETATKLYAAVKDNSDLLRPDSSSYVGPSYLSSAVQQHPVVAGAGQYGLDAYMLGAGGSALGGAAGEVASSSVPQAASSAAGLVGRLSGQGAANAAAGDPTQQGTNFLTGALGQAGGEAIGKLASYVGGNAQRIQQINNIVGNFTKSKADQAYAEIRNLPFGQADKAQLNTVVDHIGQVLDNPDLNISVDHANMLKNLAINLNNTNNFSKAFDEYQNIGKMLRTQFNGLKGNTLLFKEVSNIKQVLGTHINNTATDQGINDAISTANNTYRTRMALSGPKNGIFNNMNENLDSFSFKTATNQLNKKIALYSEMKGMEPTVQTLQGLSKLTKEIGTGYKLGFWGARMAGAGVGSAAGGYEGYEEGKELGHPVGGMIAGAIAAPLMLHGLNKFTSSPQGQAFLRSLAKPGINQQDLRNVAKGAMLMGVNWFHSQGQAGNQ